ncbi:MAG TPA: TlpA disulfide reductase family protein [Vicinamibacterales bacterium]|nr:TlpA disulfide reductase family protein [Vicinamibacterales bacterium]
MHPWRFVAAGALIVVAIGVGVAFAPRHAKGAAPPPADRAAAAAPLDGAVRQTVRLFKDPAAVPAFRADTVDGRHLSSADFHGKVVLVNFWATWCPPCREEIPELIALQDEYRDHLQIIGVSQDDLPAAQVAQFAKAHGMNYPVVMTTPALERLFPGVDALPTTFVLDRDSRLAQKHVGMLDGNLTQLETRVLAGLPTNAVVERVEDDEKVRLTNAAQANKIPGIDLAPLAPAARTAALQKLNAEHCTCGCNLTVAQCRLDDPTCPISLPLAQKIVKALASR